MRPEMLAEIEQEIERLRRRHAGYHARAAGCA